MDAKIRKAQVNLMTLGAGVSLFGLWIFVKFALTYILYGAQIDEAMDDTEMLIVQIVVWFFTVTSLLIRIYIGISARSESKGKRKNGFYLFLTGMIGTIELAAVIIDISGLFLSPQKFINIFITLIIDSTALVFLVELMVNAIIIRSLRKKAAAK